MASVHLGDGEREVLLLRTHVKRILLPVIVGALSLVLAAAAVIYLVPLAPPESQLWTKIAVAAVMGLALLFGTLLPVLRWATTTYTLTTRRLVTRSGIVIRRGQDLPLASISNVQSERGMLDRMLGCGTLLLETSAQEPVRLDDVPDAERVSTRISELAAGAHREAR